MIFVMTKCIPLNNRVYSTEYSIFVSFRVYISKEFRNSIGKFTTSFSVTTDEWFKWFKRHQNAWYRLLYLEILFSNIFGCQYWRFRSLGVYREEKLYTLYLCMCYILHIYIIYKYIFNVVYVGHETAYVKIISKLQNTQNLLRDSQLVPLWERWIMVIYIESAHETVWKQLLYLYLDIDQKVFRAIFHLKN